MTVSDRRGEHGSRHVDLSALTLSNGPKQVELRYRFRRLDRDSLRYLYAGLDVNRLDKSYLLNVSRTRRGTDRSCTTEVASFNEFTALLAEPSTPGGYDHVVFDTAPTGHTVRLLQLPGSWTDFLEVGKSDASSLELLAPRAVAGEHVGNAVLHADRVLADIQGPVGVPDPEYPLAVLGGVVDRRWAPVESRREVLDRDV